MINEPLAQLKIEGPKTTQCLKLVKGTTTSSHLRDASAMLDGLQPPCPDILSTTSRSMLWQASLQLSLAEASVVSFLHLLFKTDDTTNEALTQHVGMNAIVEPTVDPAS